jgi:enoyl-[acyl-carrier protein] reductase I
VAIVPDVRHTAAASRRVRVLPDSAAGSVVLVRAAAVVRTDSATAIDPGRAAPVVQARARVRDAVRALAVGESAAADQLDSQLSLRTIQLSNYPTLNMADFTGKTGLIVGVANKRSIAWAIAQVTATRGARLVITYQGRFEEHVNELSQGLDPAPLVLPCDVTSDSDIEAVYARIDRDFGGLDFVVHGAAFAKREDLSSPFSQTSRDGFAMAMDISAYSLIALTRGALPLLEKRGGGSVLTLSYLGSERVFPNYNVMGVAKAALEASVRYLAADVGQKNVRVNAVSAGPIKTLAAAGISGFSSILNIYKDRAPLRRNVETVEVAEAAAFLLSDAGKGITGEVVMVDAGFHVTGM